MRSRRRKAKVARKWRLRFVGFFKGFSGMWLSGGDWEGMVLISTNQALVPFISPVHFKGQNSVLRVIKSIAEQTIVLLANSQATH